MNRVLLPARKVANFSGLEGASIAYCQFLDAEVRRCLE